jgi:ketosteroid isomerase-like protein
MTDRVTINRVLRELYDARARGNLVDLCGKFDSDAKFRVAGASRSGPIAIVAVGAEELRSWLALLIKSYRLDELSLLSILIDGQNAAVHWKARIYSRVTGVTTQTELADLIEFREDRIASYTEFLVSL